MSIMVCSERIVLVAISVVSAVLVVMVMSIYFDNDNEIDMGAGDDMSIVKESSGLHILEVDGLGPGDGQGCFG